MVVSLVPAALVVLFGARDGRERQTDRQTQTVRAKQTHLYGVPTETDPRRLVVVSLVPAALVVLLGARDGSDLDEAQVVVVDLQRFTWGKTRGYVRSSHAYNCI